jgi:hypothetical protein
MKYISYSLWGDNPIYNVGIIENAKQAKEIYPDWKMVVYYDNTTPLETIIDLIALDVECVNITSLGIYGMFWRFLAADKPDCEYAVFRDADSRLSVREKAAVDEWISSGKTLHVMRDHPGHGIPFGNDRLGILGGMWGIKGNVIPLTKSILNFKKSREMNYGNDQTFLKMVYSVFENDRCTHDEFFEKKPFPIKRENGRFIGERMTIDNKPLNNDYLAIK